VITSGRNPFPFPNTSNPNRGWSQGVDPVKSKKRLRIGVLLVMLGPCLSIWIQEPQGYGLAFFIVGLLVFIVGVVLVFSAFPKLFDADH
jgi:hypothetical protein